MTHDEPLAPPAPGADEMPSEDDARHDLTYEQARDELVAIVHKLESGGAGLDESLALWERGERLATLCQGFLDGAQQRVDAARAPEEDPPASS